MNRKEKTPNGLNIRYQELGLDRKELMIQTQKQMPSKRWEHTLGVMESAAALAQTFGADSFQADIAALLHDYCKFWPIEDQLHAAKEQGLEDLMVYGTQLLHAPIGAFVVSQKFGLKDQTILDAIRYHTSGREGMTLLDKIICLADYIEPGREYPEVSNIRKLAEISLEQALIAGFDSTIALLISKGKTIYPVTIKARNELIQELANRR